MKRVIYKYPLIPGKFEYQLPKGAQVLSAAFQKGAGLMMWAEIPVEYTVHQLPMDAIPIEIHTMVVVGTGSVWPLDYRQARFIGTCMTEEHDLVFHVYEVLK